MKLYFTPGACSMAPHIMINELGLQHEHESVDLKEHKTASGQDYYQINPKGYVPALVLDSGEILTENIAILSYLTDQKSSLNGMARYRLLEMLAFVSTELHKSLGSLFAPNVPAETVQAVKTKVAKRLENLDKQLGKNQFLLGDSLTAPDAYAFTVLNWTGKLGVDISSYKNVTAFMDRVKSRPAVQKTMKEEGLLK